MSRCLAFGTSVGILTVWLLAMPVAALADVMEVDGNGVAWVSGGPTVPGETVSQSADVQSGVDLPAIPQSVTGVPDSAGPAPWRARVGELAAKYDISPALLEALVWQESRWNSNAVSPKGARGFAQLMPGTARELGVNPFDPSANLEGGARYLRAQLDTFGGDLEKALAAYNSGPHRVHRAGGIPRIRETQNYVSQILARLSAPVRR